ncbi:MAG: response regulator transcription factor, partial [Actinomycetota bacterium]|nr:response regulator transcription factor [Actinomycetota bacterium]
TDPDVVIIDLVLPGLRGLEVLRAARLRSEDSVIIVISGLSDETDRIVALEMGADDFVMKPFGPRELLARIAACQRRGSRSPEKANEPGMVFDGLSIDVDRREVVANGRSVRLTRREYDLLVYLATEPGHVYSKADLIAAVWDAGPGWIGEATVTEHVRRLRHKIEDDYSNPRWILTVRGHGYLFGE